MRIVAQSTLAAFAERHPEAKASLVFWSNIVKGSQWASMADVQATFPKAKVLNGERVRFELVDGNYRLIVAFKFRSRIVFIKFVGTHAEYDRIDALTVAKF